MVVMLNITMLKRLFLIASIGALVACSPSGEKADSASAPVKPALKLSDPLATAETKALFKNLGELAKTKVLYGHEDDLAYGVHWKGEEGRSDVKDVTGSYPAVYGWDLGDLSVDGATENLDGVSFADMKRWIVDTYKKGAVTTVSWHLRNPNTGDSSWDTTAVMKDMLPGGSAHESYKKSLDIAAGFLADLKNDEGNGEAVPVIFRPFHEWNGWWFWWGTRRGDAYDKQHDQDYIELWRFTADYLRKEKQLHNLILAFSSNSLSEFDNYDKDYWDRYPGDDYVDVLGFDDYFTLQGQYGHDDGVAKMTEFLAWLNAEASERGKLSAFTEGGMEGLKEAKWFTEMLLKSIEADPGAQGISYVLTWRNASNKTHPGHFYAAYPDHPSAADFKAFRDHPMIVFEDELPDLYSNK